MINESKRDLDTWGAGKCNMALDEREYSSSSHSHHIHAAVLRHCSESLNIIKWHSLDADFAYIVVLLLLLLLGETNTRWREMD